MMSPEEILELMELTGWRQADLARELEVSPATVCRWITGENPPSGPARIQMRQWLELARAEAKAGTANKKTA